MKPIDQISAGPILDTAAARALGWQRMKFPSDFGEGVVECWWDGVSRIESFKPSTNIADAWVLLTKAHSEKWIARILVKDICSCSLHRMEDDWTVHMEADTAALAITRAFLRACGIEKIEIDNGQV